MKSTALPVTPVKRTTLANRFTEAKKKRRTLTDIPLKRLERLQHVATMRLQLKFTGDTHAIFLNLYTTLRDQLLDKASADGTLSLTASGPLLNLAAIAWRETFDAWKARFQAARLQAAGIIFAGLARQHIHFMALADFDESRQFLEQEPPGPELFYEAQLKEVLQAADDRVYSDGFRLSQRIWRLDQAGLTGIQQIIRETIATGGSAWDAAGRLESHLGAGQDCPRWTHQRLYGLTKKDIAAGNKKGLIKGSPCKSKGISYNALRLARNEIQIIHGAATDAIFARQPWIIKEKINLSPSHPPIGCECETIVTSGEGGKGIYPKGTITVPVHVQCLCYKTAVVMDEDEFTSRMRGWVNGGQPWPEMTNYSSWIGATRSTIATALTAATIAQLALPLLAWLDGDEGEHNEMLDQDQS